MAIADFGLRIVDFEPDPWHRILGRNPLFEIRNPQSEIRN
jgi:hypothetical protein